MMDRKRLIIIGAAGRDFHNFNVLCKNNPELEVVAFTAAQIPDIEGRKYPSALAGGLYPDGIPIVSEKYLEEVIKQEKVQECWLCYSDLSHNQVMHIASRVLVSGARFSLIGAEEAMLKSEKPVIAVVAVRTGCGKSQTTRALTKILFDAGNRAATVRHPMPYGDLEKQRIMKFEKMEDLISNHCSIEEMEEYEPYLSSGFSVFSGVDYAAILKEAERNADIILWDGGNNDTSFFKPDVTIVVADPLRAGHELLYHPGEVNFRLADVILINKINSASAKQINTIVENAAIYNPRAKIIKAESVVNADNPSLIKGKRVLVIEDGPTLTHGEMNIGAGTVAAMQFGAKEIIDPRPFAIGSLKEVFSNYPLIGNVLPAMGYSDKQMEELRQTINAAECDTVVIGTPIDLSRYIKIDKPFVRISYELGDEAKEELQKLLSEKHFLDVYNAVL
jgi:predicted GTPase